MLKQVILFVASIFLFSACSSKFFDFSRDYTPLLKEANKCQDVEEYDKRLDCYKRIEVGNSFAQIKLGTYYADESDYKKALYYLNQAKNDKNIYANLPLSSIYYKGEGIEKDIEKSFKLLEDASDTDPVAAHQLSRFYLQGINTKVDDDKGVELLEFAGEKDVLQAQRMLVKVYTQGLFKQEKDQVKADYWQNKVNNNKNDEYNYNIYKF